MSPGFKPVSLVSLVDAGQLSVRYAELFAYALEGISGPGFQIIVLIIYMYRVQRSATYGRLVVAVVLAHEVVVALGAVVSVELIQLYDVYKLLGISRVGGISRSSSRKPIPDSRFLRARRGCGICCPRPGSGCDPHSSRALPYTLKHSPMSSSSIAIDGPVQP